MQTRSRTGDCRLSCVFLSNPAPKQILQRIRVKLIIICLPVYIPPPGSAIDMVRRPHRLPFSLHATARLSDRRVGRPQPEGSQVAGHRDLVKTKQATDPVAKLTNQRKATAPLNPQPSPPLSSSAFQHPCHCQAQRWTRSGGLIVCLPACTLPPGSAIDMSDVLNRKEGTAHIHGDLHHYSKHKPATEPVAYQFSSQETSGSAQTKLSSLTQRCLITSSTPRQLSSDQGQPQLQFQHD